MLNIIDSHQHIWLLKDIDLYNWLKPSMDILYRDYTINDYKKEINPMISGSILVQASPTTEETMILLKQAKESKGFVKGVVGWFDMESEKGIEKFKSILESEDENKMLVGVRPMLQDLIEDDRYILRDTIKPFIAELVSHNKVFDALIYPKHLKHLIEFYKSSPKGLKMVIDHAAKPCLSNDDCSLDRDWCLEMQWFSENTNGDVMVKISGLLTQIKDIQMISNASANNLIKIYIEFLLNTFSSKRLIWGSDWPVVNMSNRSLSNWLQTSIDIFNQLNINENDQSDIFYNNALNFYNLK